MRANDKQYAQALLESTHNRSESELVKIIKDFALLLKTDNQIVKLDRIIGHFQRFWNKENFYVEAEIVSAHELDDAAVSFLEQYIKKQSGAKEVTINSRIDKSVLGGVIIKYGDRILDAGLKSRLASFQRAIQN